MDNLNSTLDLYVLIVVVAESAPSAGRGRGRGGPVSDDKCLGGSNYYCHCIFLIRRILILTCAIPPACWFSGGKYVSVLLNFLLMVYYTVPIQQFVLLFRMPVDCS